MKKLAPKGYQWTFEFEFNLPVLMFCKSLPEGTIFYETEAIALEHQISKLTAARLTLITRLENLEYKVRNDSRNNYQS